VANPPPHDGGPYWTFLKLTTGDGISGYGEACGVPFLPRRACQLVEDGVARHVIGKSPFDIETIWRVVYAPILTKAIHWQDGDIVPPTAPGIGDPVTRAKR
jgi:galactonate dehydratase